jgi:hypothetical protein
MCAGTFLTGDETHFCTHSKIRKDIELQMMVDPDDDATQSVIYAFCSEFVSMCYQEVRIIHRSLSRVLVSCVILSFESIVSELPLLQAIMNMREKRDTIMLRLMNFDPEACSPMALHGYLSQNESMHADWKRLGKLNFNYC